MRFLKKMTLEQKCRIIFGLFILLIIAVSMFWPWYHMEQLVSRSDRERAELIAKAVWGNAHAVRLAGSKAASEQLDAYLKQWLLDGKTLARQPLIMTFPPAAEGPQDATVLGSARPLRKFERQAIGRLFENTQENYVYEVVGGELRYLQAIRAGFSDLGHDGNWQADQIIGAVSIRLPLARHQQTIFWYRVILISAAGVTAILSMLVFHTVVRYIIVRPVRHLKEIADRVSEGNLRIRSQISTGDELESLSDAFNNMLDRIEESQKELRRANVNLDAKLDELAQANVALFETNQVKNKFLATMSHELRTPLNSIIGFAEILNNAPAVAQNPKYARYVDNIISSGHLLLNIINELLDIARLEAGKMQIKCTQTSPRDVCEVVHGMIRPMVGEKSIDIEMEVHPETPIMTTDTSKLEQILYNLMSNAIKFTAEGRVMMRAWPMDREHVAFSVSDSGPGISKDQQLRIFNRFSQLDNPETRAHGGAGLGLSIVKDLVNLLGGTVSVESALGQGATFTVILPVDSSAAASDETQPAAARDEPTPTSR
ncbi:MAG: ATP-binding protein [Planctomycetia bacterium]|nr:ATP-binding protein [Planctomycetia bacterium]